MNFQALQSNWAAWLGLVAVLVAIVAILPRLLARTSRSKLRRVLADLKKTRKELDKLSRATRRAERKVEKLAQRAHRVKPRVMQEAQDTLDDARALKKIFADKLMVAENHVRRVIHDEYPPSDHDRLRRKYLPKDIEEKRPFSF